MVQLDLNYSMIKLELKPNRVLDKHEKWGK